MIEKFCGYIDQGGAYGVFLTDLSNGSGCCHHDLHIAKLHACGLDVLPLKLVHS